MQQSNGNKPKTPEVVVPRRSPGLPTNPVRRELDKRKEQTRRPLAK